MVQKQHGNRFDLVLMDCRMPVLDGWQTTQRWREYERDQGLPPTTIIAVTGCDMEDAAQNCRTAGMDDIIIKPYSASDLTSLLAKWLGQKSAGCATAEALRKG
jgi:CheY-like chemotaxis protein